MKHSQSQDNTNKIPNKQAKEYNIKPKPIHREVVRNLVDTRGSVSEAMRRAGYPETTAKNPKNVTESKGFQMALQEAGIGLDDLNFEFAKDLHDDKKRTVQHLQLGYKLHGKLKDTQEGNKTLILITTGDSNTRYKVDDKGQTT